MKSIGCLDLTGLHQNSILGRKKKQFNEKLVYSEANWMLGLLVLYREGYDVGVDKASV